MKTKLTMLFSILVITSMLLTACGAAATEAPTAVPAVVATSPAIAQATSAPVATAAPVAKYSEAPMLADQVKAGKLPPVEKRLPDQPLED